MTKVNRIIDNKYLKLFNSNGNILYFVNKINNFSKDLLDSNIDTYFFQENSSYFTNEDEDFINFAKSNNYKIEMALFDASNYLYTSDCIVNNLDIFSLERYTILKDVRKVSNIYSKDSISEVYSKIVSNSKGDIFFNYDKFKKNQPLFKRKDLKLCFIQENFAYFTNNPNQYGDDWNDKPYEHNAGVPYEEEGYEVVKIGFLNSNYSEPCKYFGFLNSPYSVDMINSKFTPWLIPNSVNNNINPIFADTSIKEFINIIQRTNGTIYINPKDIKKD